MEDTPATGPPRDGVGDSKGAYQSDQETSGGSCTRHRWDYCDVFEKCMLNILPWLLRICNASIARAYFPREWRRAKVIALRKPGKPSYESPRSYRPISLLSNVGKIIETLMNRRIMRRLEQWHVLAPSQFGFRSGREVVDACSRLVEDIVAAFPHGEVVRQSRWIYSRHMTQFGERD